MHIGLALWTQCNRRFAEKLLSEFVYERLLDCESEGDGCFGIVLGRVTYRFCGRLNVWGQPVIERDSVVRVDCERAATEKLSDCMVLFQDLAGIVPCLPLTWAQYVHECLNTLYADYQLNLERQAFASADWVTLPPAVLHALLDGHPKALPNKGRIGWGCDDLALYAPEYRRPMKLRWLAVHDCVGQFWQAENMAMTDVYLHSMDEQTLQRQYRHVRALGLNPDEYRLLPVHPWQWSHFIVLQFGSLIARQLLLDLGCLGDDYLPQPSLRTFSNLSRPQMMDIKLPLTLLNTSSYRGLPARYLAVAAEFSQWLQHICRHDACFSQGRVRVQQEPCSAFVSHPFYTPQHEAPYQYQEMLGAVWRESAESKTTTDEQVYMAAMLQQRLPDGSALITHWIRRSSLSVEEWLTRLFDCTAVPLWHWQCAYGLGFISHGQNLNIVFRQAVPVGILLKDIQGDVFVTEHFVQEPLAKLPERVAAALPAMPPHYLVHNLWTGYFASVLRFAASLLHQAALFDEADFWALLARRLRIHQENHPQWQASFAAFDLFQTPMPRLCINRARLVAGYADSGQRPSHTRGEDIFNPLCLSRPC